jgi:hypothetical protein
MRRTAVVLAALLTAGCAAGAGDRAAPSSTEPAAPPTSAGPTLPPVPGMTAEAVRQRTDEAIGGQFQVRITDTGDEPFTVTSVALDSPGFEPIAPRQLTAEYAPGRVIDLPTKYGSPVCDSGVQPAGARITVVRSGRPAEAVVVPLGGDVLALIHDEECAVRAVEQVVDIGVEGLHEVGDDLVGEVVLTRRSGDEPVAVERLSRSVLLEASAPDLPVELTGDDDELSVPVSFSLASCDPHVLAETKKPYVFPLVVRVGDGDDVPVDLPLDQTRKDRMAALVDRVCELPG